MNTSGEAADQVVRMSLEVGEAALKISGTGAKHLAVMLYAVLKEKKKTKGRVRLETLVKSGRPLTVFSVKENDLKQKMATEEIQQVQKEKSRRQEIIRKRRMHRNEERSNINEADMKYLQNTMDYKHGGISTAAGAATVDLSYVGLQMSELQQMEAQMDAQMNAELNATADAGTVDTATCDSGSSAAAASFNGSVSSGSVL